MSSKSVRLSLFVLLAWAPPAFAQDADFEFVPVLGVYSPLTTLRGIVPADSGTTTVRLTQQAGPAFGARGTFWLAGPVGLEGSFLYALSDAQVTLGSSAQTQNAHVWLASGRLVLAFGAQGGPIAFHVNGGLALIGRGGAAYDNVNSTTDLGGVIGAGASFHLNDRFSIRLDAEDYVYDLDATLEDPAAGNSLLLRRFQSDLVLSAGLSFAVGP